MTPLTRSAASLLFAFTLLGAPRTSFAADTGAVSAAASAPSVKISYTLHNAKTNRGFLEIEVPGTLSHEQVIALQNSHPGMQRAIADARTHLRDNNKKAVGQRWEQVGGVWKLMLPAKTPRGVEAKLGQAVELGGPAPVAAPASAAQAPSAEAASSTVTSKERRRVRDYRPDGSLKREELVTRHASVPAPRDGVAAVATSTTPVADRVNEAVKEPSTADRRTGVGDRRAPSEASAPESTKLAVATTATKEGPASRWVDELRRDTQAAKEGPASRWVDELRRDTQAAAAPKEGPASRWADELRRDTQAAAAPKEGPASRWADELRRDTRAGEAMKSTTTLASSRTTDATTVDRRAAAAMTGSDEFPAPVTSLRTGSEPRSAASMAGTDEFPAPVTSLGAQKLPDRFMANKGATEPYAPPSSRPELPSRFQAGNTAEAAKTATTSAPTSDAQAKASVHDNRAYRAGLAVGKAVRTLSDRFRSAREGWSNPTPQAAATRASNRPTTSGRMMSQAAPVHASPSIPVSRR